MTNTPSLASSLHKSSRGRKSRSEFRESIGSCSLSSVISDLSDPLPPSVFGNERTYSSDSLAEDSEQGTKKLSTKQGKSNNKMPDVEKNIDDDDGFRPVAMVLRDASLLETDEEDLSDPSMPGPLALGVGEGDDGDDASEDPQEAFYAALEEARLKAEYWEQRSKYFIIGCGGLAAILALTLTLSLTLVLRGKEEAIPPEPTVPPLTLEEYILTLLPSETSVQIGNNSTAQHAAYHWILDDPNVRSYSDKRIVQRFALATYYLSTGGTLHDDVESTWIQHQDWLSYEKDECIWFHHHNSGVYGSPDSDTDLMYNVSGNICDPAGNYIHLWHWENGITGSLPEEIFLLTDLRSISLDRNELQGTISSQVEQLVNLEALSLYTNNISGRMPPELGKLQNLRFLWLMKNQLTGYIPTEIGTMTSLEYFIADSQKLTGPIPTQIGGLTNLVWLWVSSNKITGSLPTEIGFLSSVNSLWLWDNKISGTIPTQIGGMKSLDSIMMDANKFTGTLPTQLGSLLQLTTLHVSSPFLKGSLPTEFGKLKEMGSIVMEKTSLTGLLPSEIGLMTNLWRFWIYGSYVSGTVPTQFGLLPDLRSLALEYSELKGQLPVELLSLEKLGQLQLRGNHLTGTIPTEVGLLAGMDEHIWLQENSFSGTIPTEFGKLTLMLELRLNGNSLIGTVPTELSNLEVLTALSISFNALKGSIPYEMCEIPSLVGDGAEGIRIDCERVECTCKACSCEK